MKKSANTVVSVIYANILRREIKMSKLLWAIIPFTIFYILTLKTIDYIVHNRLSRRKNIKVRGKYSRGDLLLLIFDVFCLIIFFISVALAVQLVIFSFNQGMGTVLVAVSIMIMLLLLTGGTLIYDIYGELEQLHEAKKLQQNVINLSLIHI